MISIQLLSMQETGQHCANPNCKRNTDCMINILGSVWYIKTDTTVALITMQGRYEYYCRDCIDFLYDLFKVKLNSKLWAFH